MANRYCDRCGAASSPYWPRKRMPNNELWCSGCAANHGRTLGATGAWMNGSSINQSERNRLMSPKVSTAGVRVAVRTKQGTLHRDAPSMQRLAHLVSGDMPPIVRLAHDSGDAVTVFHCPFCGSGQVLARSDGTIECEFCHSSFTVQIQPQFSAFPQTIDGVPVDVPGMPSNSMNPGMESGMDDPSVADAPPGEDVEPEDEEDGGEAEGDAPAFLKGSFLTHTGSALDVDDYLRHLAIECGPDRAAVIRRVKMRRGR